MGLQTTVRIDRGGTVYFSTIFYDINGNVTQPAGAEINLVFPNLDGSTGTTLISMTAPVSPAIAWTAQWDSRNVAPGGVSYSVHSTGLAIPYAVEDGDFTIEANPANLATFS